MGKSLRVVHGETLVKLGGKNDEVVVMDVDLAHATQTGVFKNKYPERFHDMGTTETSMMCTVAGFAHTGHVPSVGTFALLDADRALEQIRSFTCYINRNAKSGLPHPGLCVGKDDGNRQSTEDIALMRRLPHMTIFVSCDPMETKKVVMAVVEIDRPVYIRVARPVCSDITTAHTPSIPGKANVMKEGNGTHLIAYGLMIPRALEAAAELEKGAQAWQL